MTQLIVTEDDKHFNKLAIATEKGVEELTATHEHPFWSPSQNAWVTAGDLTAGMSVMVEGGGTAIVVKNDPYAQHAKTFNLTIEDVHTYYVLAGETPVLVHNSSCPIYTVGGPRVRPGKDIDVDADGFVNGPTAEQLKSQDVQGLSTFDSVENASRIGLKGQVRTPAGPIPDGLGVIADGRGVGGPRALGHHTVYPTRRMLFDEYVGLIQGMNWQNIGKKL